MNKLFQLRAEISNLLKTKRENIPGIKELSILSNVLERNIPGIKTKRENIPVGGWRMLNKELT